MVYKKDYRCRELRKKWNNDKKKTQSEGEFTLCRHLPTYRKINI